MVKVVCFILFGFICFSWLDFVYSEQEANHKTLKSKENGKAFAHLGKLITFLLENDVILTC